MSDSDSDPDRERINVETLVIYSMAQLDMWHRSPVCFRARDDRDLALEVHGGEPQMGDIQMQRIGDLEITSDDLCKSCVTEPIREAVGNGIAKRPPDFYWLPTEESDGSHYHAQRCSAHLIEPVPRETAVAEIADRALLPCHRCIEHHGLSPIEQDE